jgi:hypothetical protein
MAKLKSTPAKYRATSEQVDWPEYLQLKAENANLQDLIKFMDERGVNTHKYYSEWQEITGGR